MSNNNKETSSTTKKSPRKMLKPGEVVFESKPFVAVLDRKLKFAVRFAFTYLEKMEKEN